LQKYAGQEMGASRVFREPNFSDSPASGQQCESPSLRQNKRRSRPLGGFFFLAERSKPPARLAWGFEGRRLRRARSESTDCFCRAAAKRRAPWARACTPLIRFCLSRPAQKTRARARPECMGRAAQLPRQHQRRLRLCPNVRPDPVVPAAQLPRQHQRRLRLCPNVRPDPVVPARTSVVKCSHR